MHRILCSLRRSFVCQRLTNRSDYNTFWDWRGWIEHGARSKSNYTTSTSILQSKFSSYNKVIEEQDYKKHGLNSFQSERDDKMVDHNQRQEREQAPKLVGRNISAAEKRKFLVNTLMELKDTKESVYGMLDAWVAWEQSFPLSSLKQALFVLQKQEQWHRIVQVVKWMLSKGQGTTMGTYEQLIRALEKDNRAEEAHHIWKRKIAHDLHSVPWQFCDLMLSIYYRNNMLDRLIRLFRGLESYDRKPPNKSIVRKVADAYEMLGQSEERDKLLSQYNYLFDETLMKRKKKKTWRERKFGKKIEREADKDKHNDLEASDCIPVDSGKSSEEIEKI